jgi:transcriptional regulator with XRE-family HTH domain
MTQHDLAQATKMPQPSIARIEAGTVVPRTSTLMQLLAATGHQLALEPIGTEVDRTEINRRLRMSVPARTWQATGRAAKDRMTSPFHILRRLRRFNVPFVLIGPLAEAAHGAPVKAGWPVEVCHATTDVAKERLALALEDLGEQADATRLRLVTETASGDDYDVLERNAVGMHVDAEILVRVASLSDLARMRLAEHTPEDEEAAAMLRAVEDTPKPRGI